MQILCTLIIFIFLQLLSTAQTGIPVSNKAEKVDEMVRPEVDEFINRKMDSLHIPGLSLAVVRNGKVLVAKGYGYSNLELNTPMQPESQLLIGSITKSFTAVALMMLWEEGKFSLQDSIGKYVQDIPQHWNPLTIEQLLNHTSGIPTYLESPPPCDFPFDPDHYTRMNFLQEVMCLPLDFVPGTQWKYSGATGYDLLGMMIETLSGEPYYEYIRNHIYGPSYMAESGWIDYDSVIPNRVDGYYFNKGIFQNSEPLDAVGEYAHGGLMSSILDLIKFDDALFSGKLVKKSTLARMQENAVLTDGTLVPSYGLGFGLTPFEGHRRMGHTGGAPGFSTSYSRFTEDDLTIIVLTNKDADYNTLQFSNSIAHYFLN